MTRLAAPTVYSCPACAGYFTHSVLTSLHFYPDVLEWSDGMNGQWWAGLGAPVGRCPLCGQVVWVSDALEVMSTLSKPRSVDPLSNVWHWLTGDREGRLREMRGWRALPSDIRHAPRLVYLRNIQVLSEALAAPASDGDDRQIYLRRRLWWAFNDRWRRDDVNVGAEVRDEAASAAAGANKRRLLALLEHKPIDQVARGELLRQLGLFDEAVTVLTAVQGDAHICARARQIATLARQGDTRVRSLIVGRTCGVAQP